MGADFEPRPFRSNEGVAPQYSSNEADIGLERIDAEEGHRGVLDGRCRLAHRAQDLLEPLLLALGLGEVAPHPVPQLGVVVEALDLPLEKLFRLSLHRMRIAKPCREDVVYGLSGVVRIGHGLSLRRCKRQRPQ